MRMRKKKTTKNNKQEATKKKDSLCLTLWMVPVALRMLANRRAYLFSWSNCNAKEKADESGENPLLLLLFFFISTNYLPFFFCLPEQLSRFRRHEAQPGAAEQFPFWYGFVITGSEENMNNNWSSERSSLSAVLFSSPFLLLPSCFSPLTRGEDASKLPAIKHRIRNEDWRLNEMKRVPTEWVHMSNEGVIMT